MGQLRATAALAPVQASLFGDAWPKGHPPEAPAQSPKRDILAAEGNLTEVPVYVLNNKAAKARGIDPNDKEALARAYTRRIVRPATLPDGRLVHRTIVVAANPLYGNPTDLGQRIFHVLVARWEAQCRPDDPRVYTSRADICRDLGVNVCGREFNRIEHQLRAMKAMSIEYIDAWYSKPGPRERGSWAPGRKSVSIIAEWNFHAERLGAPTRRRGSVNHHPPGTRNRELLTALAAWDAGGGQGAPPGLSWIRFGDEVHESLRGRYLQPLDLAYFLALDPVSRRLYVYLNKRANDDKVTYSERLIRLKERMPLDGDWPGRVLGPLKAALDRLAVPLVVKGRTVRFLESYRWPPEGEGWDQMNQVWFHGRSHLEALRRTLRARHTEFADDNAEPSPNGDHDGVEHAGPFWCSERGGNAADPADPVLSRS